MVDSDVRRAAPDRPLHGPRTEGRRSVRVRAALRTAAGLSWQGLLVLLAVVVFGYVIGQLWSAVLPVILALLLCTLVWPLARFLRRHKWPPAAAAGVVTLMLLAVLAGAVLLIVVPVAAEAEQVARGVSDGLDSIRDWAKGPPLNLGADQLGEAIDTGVSELQSSSGTIISAILGGVGAVGSGVVTLVLAVVLLFFLLKDGPRFLPWVGEQTGSKAAGHVAELATRGYDSLASFMRSQALVGLLDAVFIGIGLLILGVPLVLPLALLTFLGAFIPIVGAFVAGAIAVLIALALNGPTDALIVLVIIVGVQQLEGNVFQPFLQGNSLKLHPAIILLAVVVGGNLAGVIGALLAVPSAALIAVAWRYTREQAARPGPPQPGHEPPGMEMEMD